MQPDFFGDQWIVYDKIQPKDRQLIIQLEWDGFKYCEPVIRNFNLECHTAIRELNKEGRFSKFIPEIVYWQPFSYPELPPPIPNSDYDLACEDDQ